MGRMYQKSNTSWRLAALAAALIVLLTLCFGLAAGRGWSRDLEQQSQEAVRAAVVRCAAQCYSVEGAYPQNVQYLEEHYGLVLNHRKYIVSYEVFSSNLMPEIRVLRRGEEAT